MKTHLLGAMLGVSLAGCSSPTPENKEQDSRPSGTIRDSGGVSDTAGPDPEDTGRGEGSGAGGDDGASGGGGSDDDGQGASGGGDPCVVVVPSDARVFSDDASVPDAEVFAVVCRNSTVSLVGERSSALVLDGGETVVMGEQAEVWVLAGGEVVLIGDAGTAWVESTTGVLDNSAGATVTECASITADLSAVSLAGCAD